VYFNYLCHTTGLDFLGASPQTPRVSFAEVWAMYGLLRIRTTIFASFLEKEEYYYNTTALNFLGASPQTPRVGFAEVWAIYDLV
jgi:uncharacterized protein YbbC (DUF1343 family)